MLRVRRFLIILAALAPLLTVTQVAADWPTYHLNNTRQGDDTTDQAIAGTAAWTSAALDGLVYGQPVIAGNQLVVATENNTVYALNATTGAVLWHTHIGAPRTDNFPCGNIMPLGITGTPVIDAGNVYVVADIEDTSTRFEFDLVTLTLASGAKTRQVNIDPGNRSGINFDAKYEQQRGALTIAGGEAYITLGGLSGDCTNPSDPTDGYRGYVISYPETGSGTVQWWASAALNSTDMEAGIWAAGGASVDPGGNVYVATGNSNHTSSSSAYDDSDGVVKLAPATLTLVSVFAPSGVTDANHGGGPTWWQDNASDADLGSTTPLQLPGGRVFEVGKSGMGYLLDVGDLGGISGGIASHRVCSATSDAAFGSMAYSVVAGVETVFVGCSDGLQAVQIAASTNNFSLGWHNTSQASNKPPIVVGGGVWAVSIGGGTLYQFDAGSGAVLASYAISGSNHFTSPSASNGMIFVEGSDRVNAVAAGPNISAVTPAAGPVAGGQTVTVRGVGFTLPMTVTFGGTAVTPAAVTATSFTLVTPAHAAGYVQVQVADGLGTSPLTAGAGYVYTPLANYVPVTPFRILDTRGGSCIQCGPGALGQGSTRTVQMTGVSGLPSGADPIPTDATAVVLNTTAVDGSSFSLLTVYPSGTGRPQASNLNFAAHSATANLLTVALGQSSTVDTQREVSIYNALGVVNVVADVEGYFEPQPSSDVSGEFHPIAPARVCDTRGHCGSNAALRAGTPIVVSVTGASGIPGDGTAAAAVLNLTGVAGTAPTFVSVFPTNASGGCTYTGAHAPPFSTLNVAAGAVEANRVMVELGPATPGGNSTSVCVYNAAGTINVILDANGWFGGSGASPGSQYQAIGPSRICDTRSGSHLPCAGLTLGAGTIRTVVVAGAGGVPSTGAANPALAVIANLTAVLPSQATYLVVYPADLAHTPHASDLNVNAGAVLPNLIVVQMDTTADAHDGDVDLFNSTGSVNAVIDVEGWFQ